MEANEVMNESDSFLITMIDGWYLRCVYDQWKGGYPPDYVSHPAIVLKMEDDGGLLLTMIVCSVLLMAALHNVEMAPIKVNKRLVYADGLNLAEPAGVLPGSHLFDGILCSELDRPEGHPCLISEEFVLLRNMMIAAIKERYRDAARWKKLLNQFRSRRPKLRDR
ncbi:Bifunctional nuclease 2-like protein [Drosera capensis]